LRKIRFPLVLPSTQIFTSASTPAIPSKLAAPEIFYYWSTEYSYHETTLF